MLRSSPKKYDPDWKWEISRTFPVWFWSVKYRWYPDGRRARPPPKEFLWESSGSLLLTDLGLASAVVGIITESLGLVQGLSKGFGFLMVVSILLSEKTTQFDTQSHSNVMYYVPFGIKSFKISLSRGNCPGWRKNSRKIPVVITTVSLR